MLGINIAAPVPPPHWTTGLCGVAGDARIHIPVQYKTYAPPVRGGSYADQQYGCTITRLTDAVAQRLAGRTAHHRYSTRTPFNSDNTKILLEDGNGTSFIVDTLGNMLCAAGTLPFGANDTPLWSNTNPNQLYFQQRNQLKRVDISRRCSGVVTVLHTFRQFTVLTQIRSKQNLSFDGDHMLIYGDGNFLGVYTISTDTVGPTAGGFNTATMDYADLLPSNRVLVVWNVSGTARNNGTELWDQNMNFIKQINSLDHHSAVGKDLDGSDIWVYEGSGDTVYPAGCSPTGVIKVKVDQAVSGTTAGETCLLGHSFSVDGHYSLYNTAGGQYALFSNKDNRSPGTYVLPVESNYATDWQLYGNELILLKLDGSEVRRLAFHRSNRVSGAYWPDPKAALSRDGKYLIFSSTYDIQPITTNNPDYNDEYLIKIQ